MSSSLPEPWLRGPLPGIPALLQPAAHALIMAKEDSLRAVEGLPTEALWARPGGIASIGFHLAHLAGSTDRLLTYARGERLNEAQRMAMAREQTVDADRPPLAELLERWSDTVARALAQLAGTAESALLERREVGKARLPSTSMGLIFHAAEHASRHTGQIVTTAKLARGAAG